MIFSASFHSFPEGLQFLPSPGLSSTILCIAVPVVTMMTVGVLNQDFMLTIAPLRKFTSAKKFQGANSNGCSHSCVANMFLGTILFGLMARFDCFDKLIDAEY